MKLQGFVSVSALLLTGCSLIHSPPPATATSVPVKTMVTLTTAMNSNLTPAGKAQPVRVCLWARSQPRFIPYSAYQSQPCRVSGNEPPPLFNDILFPGTQQSVFIPSPTDVPRWLVIGADFQQPGATQSLLEIRIPEETNSRLRICIRQQSLFLHSIIRN